jgi:hypothetical protein
MTQATQPTTGSKPAIATGWLLAFTWLFVIVCALGLVVDIWIIVWGPDALEAAIHLPVNLPSEVNVWWGLQQFVDLLFGVACVGVLVRDRDLARLAVYAAWAVVVIECVDAALKLLQLHLSLPIGAVLYALFAISLARALRRTDPRPEPAAARLRGVM